MLRYINYFIKEENLITDDNKVVNIINLKIEEDEDILNEWANHFRSHYCLDSEIDFLRSATGLSREEYLNQIKFPDPKDNLGPSTRSGDFGEILIADYAEFILKYYIPRTRYDRKINRNSSSMGSDLIGFKMGKTISHNDELIVFEVKAMASEGKPKNRLQDAIEHSNKDVKRLAESLNAIVQRLIDKNDFEGAKIIQRFQNSTDRPYKEKFAAAAVHSKTSFSRDLLTKVDTSSHTDPDLFLLVVHSDNLMSFIHELYRRASKC
ncbi:Hachiman antiphage defense system protein HamA [Paraclostridium bifermentans]